MTSRPGARRLLPVFPCVLAVYLVLRYGPLLRGIAPQGPGAATGISDSLVGPVLAAAILLAASFLFFRSRRLPAWIARDRWAALPLLALLFIAIGLGKSFFPPYTDELRDATVLELVAERGPGLYLDDPAETEGLSDEQRHRIGWSQRLHPPGHYALGAAFSGSSRTLESWRYLYAAPWLVALVIGLALARRQRTRLAVFCGIAVFAAATYLRNYTFIRLGNELNPFLGITGFLASLAWAARSGGWRPASLSLAVLCAVVAVFSKFSALVSLFAVLGALGVVLLVHRDRKHLALFGGAVTVIAATVVLYGLLFSGTYMLDLQLEGYGARILRALRLVSDDAAKEMASGQRVGGRPIGYFLLRAPFQFGPVVLLTFGYATWCILARRVAARTEDLFLLVFVALNLLGVLLVNPRVQYTAPMMGAVACFAVSVLARRFGPGDTARLATIAVLFAAAEVALML